MKEIKYRKILLILVGLLLVFTFGFIIWAANPANPSPVALEQLGSGDEIFVSTGKNWITFEPAHIKTQTGLVFYPGARVDPRSYAPVLRQIALEGYRVVLVQMPLNFAIFNPDAAINVINAYPEIKNWFLAGHSLGGAMAATLIYEEPSLFQGIILWASYPASSNNLTNSSFPVLSIYASEDGLATRDEVLASKTLLPASTRWYEISGGNHSQFGSYGFQAGDLSAQISPQQQWDQVSEVTVRFMVDTQS